MRSELDQTIGLADVLSEVPCLRGPRAAHKPSRPNQGWSG